MLTKGLTFTAETYTKYYTHSTRQDYEGFKCSSTCSV